MKADNCDRAATLLTLADNSVWGISAGDNIASGVLKRLIKVMQLHHQLCASPHIHVLGNIQNPESPREAHRIQDFNAGKPTEYTKGGLDARLPLSTFFYGHGARCELHPTLNEMQSSIQLSLLSLVIARCVEASGGLLLHGALAEWNGAGVILAGPGGIGKTTASRRLPPPWRSLCDDTVLLVRDAQGIHWAHPWPTWSRYLFDESCSDTWNVELALPVKALVFLRQAEADVVSVIGSGHAAAALVQSSEQGSMLMPYATEHDRRTHRVKRFETICDLSCAVPSYVLELSLTGAFWRLLENTITARGRGPL